MGAETTSGSASISLRRLDSMAARSPATGPKRFDSTATSSASPRAAPPGPGRGHRRCWRRSGRSALVSPSPTSRGAGPRRSRAAANGRDAFPPWRPSSSPSRPAETGPAYVVRWHYGFYPTTLLEHAIVATVVVFAVETWRAHGRLVWRTPWTVPALLFILAGAISVVTAPNKFAALGLFRAYLIEPIVFAVVLVHAVTTWRRAVLILSGFGIAGAVVGVANAFVVINALLAHTYDVIQTPPVVIYTTANALALFLG